jgi:hypothetical protein
MATFGSARADRAGGGGGGSGGGGGPGGTGGEHLGVSSEEYLAANMSDILTMGPQSTEGARMANDVTMYR